MLSFLDVPASSAEQGVAGKLHPSENAAGFTTLNFFLRRGQG